MKNTKIQIIRAIAVFSVIVIHSLNLGNQQIFVRPFFNFAVGLFIFISGYLTFGVCNIIVINNYLMCILCRLIICIILPNVILLFMYRNNDNYIFYKNLLLKMLKRVNKMKRNSSIELLKFFSIILIVISHCVHS